jgi:hypothetical protein
MKLLIETPGICLLRHRLSNGSAESPFEQKCLQPTSHLAMLHSLPSNGPVESLSLSISRSQLPTSHLQMLCSQNSQSSRNCLESFGIKFGSLPRPQPLPGLWSFIQQTGLFRSMFPVLQSYIPLVSRELRLLDCILKMSDA